MTRKLCCLGGVSTLTGFAALAVEIGDWSPFTGRRHRRVPGAPALGVDQWAGFGAEAGSAQLATVLFAGCMEGACDHKPRYTGGEVFQARCDQARRD